MDAYILLHILLALHHRIFTDLEAHLRRTIIQEASKGRLHVSTRSWSRLGSLLRIAILLLLGL